MHSTTRKLVLLGSLYLAQGLPYGFFTQALPVLLRERGLSLPLIGLANLLALPWALKFVWAPWIDAITAPRHGRRRAAIIPLQLASCAVLAGVGFAAPENVWLLCAAILVVNLVSATQDIATDGLAVELLTPAERGLGNGLQVGGYRTGMIVGGGLMLLVLTHAGWVAAFAGMAGILLAATIPVVVFREPPVREPGAPRTTLDAIRASLERPGMARWIAVLVTYKTGEWFASGMLRTFLKDSGQSLGDIGVMLGIVAFSAALAGALAGGTLVTTLGRRRALVLFGVLQTVAIASFALAAQVPSTTMFYAVTVAEHFTSAMATAALFTAMMDISRPERAGTDYTVQACIQVIAGGIASSLSGVSAGALGYTGHFLASAALSALAVIVVVTYRPGDAALALRAGR